jgi:hypothetical protein
VIADADALGWRAYRTDVAIEDSQPDGVPLLAFYCPNYAYREFGVKPVRHGMRCRQCGAPPKGMGEQGWMLGRADFIDSTDDAVLAAYCTACVQRGLKRTSKDRRPPGWS